MNTDEYSSPEDTEEHLDLQRAVLSHNVLLMSNKTLQWPYKKGAKTEFWKEAIKKLIIWIYKNSLDLLYKSQIIQKQARVAFPSLTNRLKSTPNWCHSGLPNPQWQC